MDLLSPAVLRAFRSFVSCLDLLSADLIVNQEPDGSWLVIWLGASGRAAGLGSALMAAVLRYAEGEQA